MGREKPKGEFKIAKNKEESSSDTPKGINGWIVFVIVIVM